MLFNRWLAIYVTSLPFPSFPLSQIFIILKQKHEQKSFLHVYHHSTIGFIWGWLLLNRHGNGTAAYGALINSVVHVLMYTHYFVTAIGLKNPLKNYLTRFQITQFFTCICHAILVSFTSYDTKMPKGYAHVQFGYHITMISLFSLMLAANMRKTKTA
jgi:elongation of very long chain fatty acids protein 4